jgi:hypothetical protein
MNLASLSTSEYPYLLIHPKTRPRVPINCGTRGNVINVDARAVKYPPFGGAYCSTAIISSGAQIRML